MKNKKYTIYLVSITIISILTIFILNFVVDPYNINKYFRKEGFNYYKTGYSKNTREWKVYNSLDIDPNILFLGSSTMEYLKPEDYFFNLYKNNVKPFNMAHSNATAFESYYYLKYSTDNFNIDKVIYGVDFYSLLDTGKLYYGKFDINFLKSSKLELQIKKIKNYFSLDALIESVETIKNNLKNKNGLSIDRHFNEYGSRTNKWRELTLDMKGDKWIEEKLKSTNISEYNFYIKTKGISIALQSFFTKSRILTTEKNIQMIVFTPPFHALFYKKLINSSLYEVYVDYLVFLSNNGGFYYFQGDNEFTNNINLFWDSYHSRRQMSNIIFNHIFENICRDDYFGCFIDSSNIKKLLNFIERERNDNYN